jgi:hypothetical protein
MQEVSRTKRFATAQAGSRRRGERKVEQKQAVTRAEALQQIMALPTGTDRYDTTELPGWLLNVPGTVRLTDHEARRLRRRYLLFCRKEIP